MGHKKTLLCDCGQSHLVDAPQAGSVLLCRCGEKIQVPTLREIAQLPDAPATEEKAHYAPRRWTRTQGLFFAVGAASLLLAGGTATALFANLPPVQLPGRAGQIATLDSQLDTLGPKDTLELWRFYQSAPETMVSIAEKTRLIQKQRETYTIMAWAIGLTGFALGVVLIAFSLRSPKPRNMAARTARS
ncbi:MAG: hypothetical protein P8M53_08075 [Pirellulales bacterium]|nr:hypothetical protein [Pirellulales bacterium]